MISQNYYSFNKIQPTTSKLLNKNSLPKTGFSSYSFVSHVKLDDIPEQKELVFDSFTGLLRPGIYQMSLDEIQNHKVLGGTKRRQKLIDELQQAIQTYKEAGINDIYLGGSFTSIRKNPDDIDGFAVFNNKQYENLGKVGSHIDFTPCNESNIDNIASFFSNNNSRGLIKII